MLTNDDVRTVCANIVAVDRVGRYRIDAEGFSVSSRYPENRMAKMLFDAGYRGRMEVYGPSADRQHIILRSAWDIEKMAARQMPETSEDGFKFIPWTEKSLKALEGGVREIPLPKDAREPHGLPNAADGYSSDTVRPF